MRFDIESRVRNGKISQAASDRIKEAIIANENKVLRFTLETIGNNRSTQQSRFYWSVVVTIFQAGLNDIGERMTKEDCHRFICQNTKGCWRTIVHPTTGEMKDTLVSSTEHTTVSWEAWIEEIRQLGAEFLGVFIPEPSIDWKEEKRLAKTKPQL